MRNKKTQIQSIQSDTRNENKKLRRDFGFSHV